MNEETQKITVETVVHAPLARVWACWTEPEHIKQWNAASDDWHAPAATNDLRVGGTFSCRMEARDQSAGFDFGGTYTAVEEQAYIAYTIPDGRMVDVRFEAVDEGVKITETFDMEHENPAEMQRAGWQAILNHFKRHVEAAPTM